MVSYMSESIRKWLRPFGLDQRQPKKIMAKLLTQKPGRGKALDLAQKFTQSIDAALKELTNKDQQIEFLEELYYNLGGIMHALISKKMTLEGVKELEKPPDFMKEISVPFPLSDHMRCYTEEKVTFHPYEVKMECFKELIEQLERKGFTFSVSGKSEYFPGHTFKIIIERRES